ncbi:hypothetical protein EZV62_005171 [Acer yangbiense]|uniref:DUF4283 domain-containing protein n=1 Tax=Acer yangbiense TaxID=1000413 RepID=A0A5C7IP31_9ROSI|nr:hypothetical protein EZV62_005171 [Acer yangbiense]
MDVEEIARLCVTMTLKDWEGPVRTLKKELRVEGSQMMSSSLVGKILSKQQVNREAFMAFMAKIWRVKGRLNIETVSHNIFAFQFSDPGDKRMVIAGGPWSFDNALIIFEEPKGRREIRDMQFKLAEFWVQLHNVPMLCMTAEIGRFLGSIIGNVVECPEGCGGVVTKAGEDLPFGFWLKVAAPAKKKGFWGRRSEGKYDHGEGRRFTGNNEGRSEVAKQVRDNGEVGEPTQGWSMSHHMQPGKGDSSKGKESGIVSDGNNDDCHAEIVQESNSYVNNGMGMFIFKGTQTQSLAQVEGDVSASNGSIGKCPLDKPTEDAKADTISVDIVKATTKMKVRKTSADVAIGVNQGNGNIGESNSAARAEMGMVTTSTNTSQTQGSSGSWKRRARGVGSNVGQAGTESRQGKNDGSQDDSFLGKRGLVDGGVPVDKKQRRESVSEDELSKWYTGNKRELNRDIKSKQRLKVNDNWQLLDFLSLCMTSFAGAEVELLCLVLWRVWFRRNLMRNDEQLLSSNEVVPWAKSFLLDFQKSNAVKSMVINSGSRPPRIWKPSDVGLFKLNTDAAINEAAGTVGKISAGFSPLVAEVVALLRGLCFARDAGLWPCLVELDALSVVNLILDNGPLPYSEISFVFQDIKNIIVGCPDCKVAFAPRLANMAAHSLAKFVLTIERDGFWLEDCPPEIFSAVLGDCPSLIGIQQHYKASIWEEVGQLRRCNGQAGDELKAIVSTRVKIGESLTMAEHIPWLHWMFPLKEEAFTKNGDRRDRLSKAIMEHTLAHQNSGGAKQHFVDALLTLQDKYDLDQ